MVVTHGDRWREIQAVHHVALRRSECRTHSGRLVVHTRVQSPSGAIAPGQRGRAVAGAAGQLVVGHLHGEAGFI